MPRAMRARGPSVCGKILVAKPDRPLVGRHARERVGKCSLPVTFDAGNSENLAGLNRKLEPVDRIRFGSRAQSADVHDRQNLTRERGSLRKRRDFTADHGARKLTRVRLRGLVARYDRAGAHDVDFRRIGDDFGELVRDDEDCDPALCERDDRREERLDLARREHRGRLVEQQDRGLALQLAQQLDALLQSDRKRFDDRVRIDVQTVALAQLADARARRGDVEPPAFARLASEQHVFPNAQALDELKMLVDETDDAVAFDRSLVGSDRAESDVRERRFSGAVLADRARRSTPDSRSRSTPPTATRSPKRLTMPRSASAGIRESAPA